MTATAFLMYSVRDRRRIVRVADVREIAPLMALDVLDEARGTFRGMMNLRGDIVPVFDLNSPDAPLHPSRLVLVTRRGDALVGLIVDEVHEVISVDESSIAKRPIGDGSVVSAIRFGGELLTILDPSAAELGGAAHGRG